MPLPRPAPMTRGQWLFDVAFAGFGLLVSLSLAGVGASVRIPVGGWVAIVTAYVALAARRAFPLASFVVVLVASAAFALGGMPLVALGIGPLISIYSVASVSEPRTSVAALASTAAAVVVVGSVGSSSASSSTMAGNAVMLFGGWLVGESVARRRREVAVHRERAEVLERSEGERAAQAVADERLRIARELHDIVAHSMSVVAVQAGTARLALDRDPATTAQALQVIEATSREALDEMRRMLGLLRGSDGEPIRAPAPGLSELGALIDAARRDGLEVSIHEDHAHARLAAGTEATVYRIIQEALANVRRHAPGATVEVRLAAARDELSVVVENDRGTPAATSLGAGLGLIGVRERVAVFGGTVDAGPTAGGGWRLAVAIPLQVSATAAG